MPMPHRTQMQVIKRRLVGKEGTERIRELHSILADLPDYRNGPYADIRKWVHNEIDRARVRAKIVHRDSIAVRREGAAQIALVGAPNAGKSSLLQALSEIQIKTGDYAFTTLRPIAALTRIGGVLVQLVEIPGLIGGASDGRGDGRALLGVLRNADAALYCHAATAPLSELETVRGEIAAAGIDRPALLAVTKLDEADGDVVNLAAAAAGLRAVGVSILDDDSLGRLRDELWGMTGLIRVYLRRGRSVEPDPVALTPASTVEDVAASIHGELLETCRGARVWGPSARFAGQQVGRHHLVADGDVIEILA